MRPAVTQQSYQGMKEQMNWHEPVPSIGFSKHYTKQWCREWGRSMHINRWVAGTDCKTLKMSIKKPNNTKALKCNRNILRLYWLVSYTMGLIQSPMCNKCGGVKTCWILRIQHCEASDRWTKTTSSECADYLVSRRCSKVQKVH